MARGRQTELLGLAIASLRHTGFLVAVPNGVAPYGRNVRTLRWGDRSETVLIQARSYDPNSHRYMVGIILADLARVDSVVLWFEDESRYLRIPSLFLQQLHNQMRERSLARYTGEDEQQWRIDIHLDEHAISPQGSRGERFPAAEYIYEVGRLPVG